MNNEQRELALKMLRELVHFSDNLSPNEKDFVLEYLWEVEG